VASGTSSSTGKIRTGPPLWDHPVLLAAASKGEGIAEPSLLAKVVKQLGTRATLHEVEGGDHSFNVRGAKASPRDVGAGLAPIVAAWITER